LQMEWDYIGSPVVQFANDWVVQPAYHWATDVEGWVDWWNQPGVDWAAVASNPKEAFKSFVDVSGRDLIEGFAGGVKEFTVGVVSDLVPGGGPVLKFLLGFASSKVAIKAGEEAGPHIYNALFSEDQIDNIELDEFDQELVDQMLGEGRSDLNIDPKGPLFGVDHVDVIEADHEGVIEGQFDAEFAGSGYSDGQISDAENLLPYFDQFAEQQNVVDLDY